MSKPKGKIRDALKTDAVKLLESDPKAYVQRTSRQSFGFVDPKPEKKK